ncbi:hypothetical protein O3M35_000511 [Rhynocoris fuscipes]|uniref:Aminopeptidase n=1 Tax=Rhynocoris fuscipes TaxID=488301 RepID=A0AAW1DPR4_9HEMI
MEGGNLTKDKAVYHVSRKCAAISAVLIVLLLAISFSLMYLLVPKCPCSLQPPIKSTQSSVKPVPLYVRLPTSVSPIAYDIRLIPFIWPGNFTFNGDVTIIVNVTQETSNITLHATELAILQVNLSRISDNNLVTSSSSTYVTDAVEDIRNAINIDKTELEKEREFLIIYPDKSLKPGQYKLSIKFVGILNNALNGFYRSSYNVNNITRWIATTQFQSTDARRAFPCFDEPALKAKFTISIGRPKNMTSISNMPHIGSPVPVEGIPDYEWDHFKQSVPMSTYLVAFCVTDFDHLSDGTFKVWARNEAIQQARYALEIGPKILRYFESFFQISFPLPKIDMVALPDFAAGAMENWGLITFRESAMLYQLGVSANKHKQRVGTIVAHELGHQWFGNLVTPSWWSDLWLNEGFATYIEYLGVDHVEPTWRTSDQFVVNDLQNVLQQDAYKSSHPVSASVSHPNEIDEIFDSISYGKGASIIRMMNHFLTKKVFKSGLTNYLNSRIYQSATQNDLWQALTEQAHLDNVLPSEFSVKEIMDTWTLKTGFPVITVTRNYDDGSAFITQTLFQYGMNTSQNVESDWWVPLSYTNQEKADFTTTQPSHWMKAEGHIRIDNLNTQFNHWVIFNINETGFYRVNYDMVNWEMLISHLMHPTKYLKIGELNRAQIIDDSFNLARAGLLNYSVAFNISKYLAQETSYFPWASAFPALNYIDSMINKMPIYDKFKKFVLHLMKKLYEETGYVDYVRDEQLTIYKRAELFKWACDLGQEECVRSAITQFQNWRVSPSPDRNNPTATNLKGTIYCTALREGSQAEWDFAWKRFLNANVGSEKSLLLGALGCTRETWILSRYLHWAITEGSGIRPHDAVSVFGAVSNNVIGQPLAFAFLRDNWQRIKQYFGTNFYALNSIIRVTTSVMNTEFELRMLKEFAELHKKELGTGTKVIDMAIEHAEANVHWMQNNYKQVEDWLKTVEIKDDE